MLFKMLLEGEKNDEIQIIRQKKMYFSQRLHSTILSENDVKCYEVISI